MLLDKLEKKSRQNGRNRLLFYGVTYALIFGAVLASLSYLDFEDETQTWNVYVVSSSRIVKFRDYSGVSVQYEQLIRYENGNTKQISLDCCLPDKYEGPATLYTRKELNSGRNIPVRLTAANEKQN